MLPSSLIDTATVRSAASPLAQLAAELEAVEADVRALAGIGGACGDGALAGAVGDFAARWGAELARQAFVIEDLAARVQANAANYEAAEQKGAAMMRQISGSLLTPGPSGSASGGPW
jgi:hypothetical protein